MVVPNFSGEASFAEDHNAGIVVEVIGTGDLESVRIYFSDEKLGAKFSFPASLIARGSSGKFTNRIGPGASPCGYYGIGEVGEYLKQTNLSLEDVKTYVIEGLRLIASNKMAIPKDDVVIQVTLTA